MNSLHSLFDWLLAASLRASLLALVVLLLQAALRRHLTARMRYALWLPVLTVLLMPVFPQSRWSVETVFAKPPQPVQITPAPIDFSPSTIPFDDRPSSPAPKPFDWPRIFSMVWLIGALGILLFGSFSFLVTLRRFKRSRHLVSDELTSTIAQIAGEIGLRRVPRIWIASAIHSPAVTGLLRPTLLLPAQFDRTFTPAEARLVLKHELMHLKRHDLPLNAVLCVLMALHWFNPLLWLAFFKARLDREAACDAQVLQNDSTDRRREYGHALLKVETAFCPRGLSLGFVGIFQRGDALRLRIRSIATHHRPNPSIDFILTGCVLMMTFFGVTSAQQNQPPKADERLVSIELRILEFTKATEWDFGGKLKAAPKDGFATLQLTQSELTSLMQDLLKQPGLNTTAYPRMVTRNDREATLRSVIQQPYKDEKGEVAYLPVGFVCNLTPSLHEGNIRMKTDITNGEIVQHEPLVTRSSVFRSELDFAPGHSAVIFGWDKGTPQSKRPLLYVITPKVVETAEGGLPATNKPPTPDTADDGSSFIAAKLQQIILPSVQFRDAKLSDCIDYFRAVSKKLDATIADPAQRGVNILLRSSPVTDSARISLDLKNVQLIEALRETAELANLEMNIRPYAVTIEPQSKKTEIKPGTLPKTDVTERGDKLILPQVEFRDTPLSDALDFIRIKSRDIDPSKNGVNLLLKGDGGTAKITLSLKNVPVSEALRYCAELANHKISADENAFVLTPKTK